MKHLAAVFFVLFTLTLSLSAFGDTPAPGTVKAKLFSGDGNTSLGATGSSLNVNVTNTTGLTTVNQGSAGASAWPVSLASQPLPTGAATETSLLGVNTNLTSILGRLPTLVGGNMPVTIQNASLAVTGAFYPATQPVSGTFWQATQPVSIATMPTTPVTGTFWQATQPVSGNLGRSWTLSSGTDSVAVTGTITATNSANGATGSAVPAQATQVAGSDGTNLRALKVSSTGVVAVDGSAVTQPVSGTFWQATQPVSAASLPLPTGAATAAKQPALGVAGTPSSDVITVQGATSMTALKTDGSAVTQPVSASALPLPSGASTSALQTSGNSSLSTIATNTTGVATAANQTTGNSSLSSIASNTANIPPLGQALAAASVPVVLPSSQVTALTPPTSVTVTQATGTNLHAVIDSGAVTATISGTPNVAVTSSALPTGAATAANQSTEISSLSSIDGKLTGVATAANQSTEISTLSSIDAGIPTALGNTTMSASMPVTIASDQSAIQVSQPDLFLTGQSAQTATINNILPATASANATDASGYRSGSVQVVSTGTAGTFIFEQSNDNVNFQPMGVYNASLATGVTITSAITASASSIVYSFPIRSRYIRLRIASTITGGSIQAFTRVSQESWSPAVMTVAQGTAANLATSATIASGTVTTVSTVTSDNLAAPGIIADVASAALTTTTTTSAFTPTNGVGYKVTIPVTVVSGTTPTMVVQVQESGDTGTNWTTVYTFPTISATGYYESPPLFFKGNRVRYVQTVAGTTPSFTRAINRLQMSAVAATPVNNNATFATGTVSTSCTTLAAPANAVAFMLQNLSSNTVNMYWAMGALATSSSGMMLEPGRDTGEVHAGVNISLCAASGTPTYSLQWVQQ